MLSGGPCLGALSLSRSLSLSLSPRPSALYGPDWGRPPWKPRLDDDEVEEVFGGGWELDERGTEGRGAEGGGWLDDWGGPEDVGGPW